MSFSGNSHVETSLAHQLSNVFFHLYTRLVLSVSSASHELWRSLGSWTRTAGEVSTSASAVQARVPAKFEENHRNHFLDYCCFSSQPADDESNRPVLAINSSQVQTTTPAAALSRCNLRNKIGFKVSLWGAQNSGGRIPVHAFQCCCCWPPVTRPELHIPPLGQRSRKVSKSRSYINIRDLGDDDVMLPNQQQRYF